MHGAACMASLGEGVVRVKVQIHPWPHGIAACVFALSCEPERRAAAARTK